MRSHKNRPLPKPGSSVPQRARPQDVDAIQRIAKALGKDGVTVVAAAVYLLNNQTPTEQLAAIHLMERDALQREGREQQARCA